MNLYKIGKENVKYVYIRNEMKKGDIKEGKRKILITKTVMI